MTKTQKQLLEIEGRKQAYNYACMIAGMQARQSRDSIYLAQHQRVENQLPRISRKYSW